MKNLLALFLVLILAGCSSEMADTTQSEPTNLFGQATYSEVTEDNYDLVDVIALSDRVQVRVDDDIIYNTAYYKLDDGPWVEASFEPNGQAWIYGKDATMFHYEAGSVSQVQAAFYSCSKTGSGFDCHEGWKVITENVPEPSSNSGGGGSGGGGGGGGFYSPSTSLHSSSAVLSQPLAGGLLATQISTTEQDQVRVFEQYRLGKDAYSWFGGLSGDAEVIFPADSNVIIYEARIISDIDFAIGQTEQLALLGEEFDVSIFSTQNTNLDYGISMENEARNIQLLPDGSVKLNGQTLAHITNRYGYTVDNEQDEVTIDQIVLYYRALTETKIDVDNSLKTVLGDAFLSTDFDLQPQPIGVEGYKSVTLEKVGQDVLLSFTSEDGHVYENIPLFTEGGTQFGTATQKLILEERPQTPEHDPFIQQNDLFVLYPNSLTASNGPTLIKFLEYDLDDATVTFEVTGTGDQIEAQLESTTTRQTDAPGEANGQIRIGGADYPFWFFTEGLQPSLLVDLDASGDREQNEQQRRFNIQGPSGQEIVLFFSPLSHQMNDLTGQTITSGTINLWLTYGSPLADNRQEMISAQFSNYLRDLEIVPRDYTVAHVHGPAVYHQSEEGAAIYSSFGLLGRETEPRDSRILTLSYPKYATPITLKAVFE